MTKFRRHAALSTALRMLLSGETNAKPINLLIAATTKFDAEISGQLTIAAMGGEDAFVLVFDGDEMEPVLQYVMVFEGSTKPGEVYVGTCHLLKKPDGRFALVSSGDEPQEITLEQKGRLIRRVSAPQVEIGSQRLAGLEALYEMSLSPQAVEESLTAQDH